MSRKSRKSIIHEKDGTCFLCMMLNNDYRIHADLEKHHIFGGANRKHSEAEGLYCWLCQDHHRNGENGKKAVHSHKATRQRLQAYAQKVYEQTHTREEFMRIFGRNYR